MFVLLQDRRFSESERQHTENIAREIRNVDASLKHVAMGLLKYRASQDPEGLNTPVDS